ncbi:MAG: hypothetical protein LBC29_06005 [Propionibacteriaceae bacterium]|nr:hypothetical protein [Propionibacteriaceae bacterium]
MNKLVLPRPTPMALPDPDNNEWKMLAVGFPVWLYAPSQSVVTNTVVQDGLTIKITATPVSYVFDMGNRDVVSCVRMPRRPVNLSNPMGESPDCGYTYLDPGVYNISLAVTWRIDWSAVGITGSFNHTPSAVFALKPLPIGELHAVIVDTEENI